MNDSEKKKMMKQRKKMLAIKKFYADERPSV